MAIEYPVLIAEVKAPFGPSLLTQWPKGGYSGRLMMEQGVDVKRPWHVTLFGVLFLLSAPIELYFILKTGWNYTPKFFGFLLSGIPAKLYLAAQPLLHVLLGYGFLTLRRWAIYLALIYAADTLTSSFYAFFLEGYGRRRTLFIAALVPFVIYILAVSKRFRR